ncbi:uncharacterized protein P884DRAFT_315185, partial [Thermothelomyces heterothallicus CBS 202.75]|uniref:uncharacterized protein n=1 Tax=Thermothelomyces heterothallicus CBS 202.75 TaxID=1149848 RepID=UPI0037433DD9
MAALQGAGTVVSAIRTRSVSEQETVVDAAVEAGVRFFVPSQFGLADTHPLLQTGSRRSSIATAPTAGSTTPSSLSAFGSTGASAAASSSTSTASGPGCGTAASGPSREHRQGRRRRPGGQGGRGQDGGADQGRRLLAEAPLRAGRRGCCRPGRLGWEVTMLDTAKAKAVASEKLARGTATLDDIYAFVYRAATAEEYG